MTNEPVPPVCPECYGPMKLVRTLPKLEELPQLFAYYCAACGVAETKKQENGAEEGPAGTR